MRFNFGITLYIVKIGRSIFWGSKYALNFYRYSCGFFYNFKRLAINLIMFPTYFYKLSYKTDCKELLLKDKLVIKYYLLIEWLSE